MKNKKMHYMNHKSSLRVLAVSLASFSPGHIDGEGACPAPGSPGIPRAGEAGSPGCPSPTPAPKLHGSLPPGVEGLY